MLVIVVIVLMLAEGAFVFLAVMIAGYFRVKLKLACKQIINRFVRVSGYAAVKLNFCFGQRCLGTSTDTAPYKSYGLFVQVSSFIL